VTVAVRAAPDLTPAGRLARLYIRGRTSDALTDANASGSVTFSTSEVSSIDLTVIDPRLELLAAGLFASGTPLSYAGLPFVVTALEVNDDPGVAQLLVTALSTGAQRARGIRGAHTRRHLSPSQYVAAGAAAVGLRAVVQPTARRGSITRAGAQKGQPAETEWDCWQRLAGEEGMICFESDGVVYFARPSWLMANLTRVALAVGDQAVLGLPRCRRTINDPAQPVTVTADVLDSLAERLLPGVCAELAGVPTFDHHYVVTSTVIPLDDAQACTVTAASAVDPHPSAPAGKGRPTAAKFVTAALGEVGHGDPAPPAVNPAAQQTKRPTHNVLDGGELIHWAAARVGITVDKTPAGLYSQAKAHGLAISLAAGKNLRGAILYRPGVAGISLGDGRAIAPHGATYRIVSASTGWTAASRLYRLEY
jgi:hypothetical protein